MVYTFFMKEIIRIDKKTLYKYIVLIIISLGIIIFTYHNHFIYKTSILKIDSIKTSSTVNEDSKEKYITQ